MRTMTENKIQSSLSDVFTLRTLTAFAMMFFMGAGMTAFSRASFDFAEAAGELKRQNGVLSYEIHMDKSKATLSMSEFKHKAAYPVAAAETLAGLGLVAAAYRKRQNQTPAP